MPLHPSSLCDVRVATYAKSDFLVRCIDQAVAQLKERPGALWENISAMELSETVRRIFQRAREERGNRFALPADVMFPTSQYPIRFNFYKHPGKPFVVDIQDAEELQGVQWALSGEWEDLAPSHPAHEMALELTEAGILVPSNREPKFDQPGLYRLQHAGLLFRSRRGTGIVVDPVADVYGFNWIMPQHIPNIDAVVVSHSHTDHFSLITLLQFPRKTMMIVPKVGRSSMLCPDMEALLRDAGFEHVVAAPWYSTVQVKDATIRVYPFYGEQPWLTFASPVEDLRNQGNTYAVEIDDYRAWFLIDSGQEFAHSMMEVCERALEDAGPVDIVLSNLRSFWWHPKQIDGSGRYLFCFPVEVLEQPETWPQGRMTFGPEGVCRFLERLKPKSFLPYAHWWQPREETVHVVGNDNETDMLDAIRDAKSAERLVTELCRWQVGDRMEWYRGRMSIRSDAR